jgi:sugar-specific transcriptional regulator TrmB
MDRLIQSEPSIRSLRSLGLSVSEAELYVVAVRSGGGDAKTLSKMSGVPYAKVYTALKKLVEKGWLVETEGYPKSYVPRHPREAIKIHRNRLEQQFAEAEKSVIEELGPAFELKNLSENPQVWVLGGAERIVAKAGAMIVDAEREVDIAIPVELPNFDEITAVFKTKLEYTPLQIRVLTSPQIVNTLRTGMRFDAQFRLVEKMFGGGVITDKSEALIFLALEKNPMAIWAKHSALAEIAHIYFDYLWAGAKRYTG